MGLLLAIAWSFARRRDPPPPGRLLAGVGLAVMATVFFWLNFALSGIHREWFTDWRGMAGWRHSGAWYVAAWLTLAGFGIAWVARARRPDPGTASSGVPTG